MSPDFTVEVPIALKEKSGTKNIDGKRIGEQIANQVKKSLNSLGIGKGPNNAGSPAVLSGISRGLGKVALGITAAVAGIGVLVGILRRASPQLAGVLSILGRAFMIFFRPFGDFLATLLRPLAIALLRMAVAFLKWTRSNEGAGKAVAGAGVGAAAGAAIGSIIPGVGTLAGAAIGAVIGGIGPFIWETFTQIGENIFYALAGFGAWLRGEFDSAFAFVIDFGSWLWEKLMSVWTYTEDFGTFLWEKLMSVWNYAKDFGVFLWDQLKGIWHWPQEYDLASWLWGKIKESLSSSLGGSSGGSESGSSKLGVPGMLFGKLADLGSRLRVEYDKAIGGYQTGTPFVPETGLYRLHRGEQVLSRNQVNNKNMSYKPTLNINIAKLSSEIDIDEVIRRASRMTEMELNGRGI